MPSTYEQAFALHQQGNLAGAKTLYEDLLKEQPQHADAWHLLGLIAFQTGNPARAVELIDKAITLHPGTAAFHGNRATALQQLGQLEAAAAGYDRAVKLDPAYVKAHYSRGMVLHRLGRLDDAVAGYDQVLRLAPDNAEAHCTRAMALQELKRLDAALAGYDQALKLRPAFPEALYNRGNALQERGRPKDALASYDQALKLKPDFAEAHYNRGLAQQDLKQPEAALASFSQALKLAPDMDYLYGSWLLAKMAICDWCNRAADEAALFAKIERGQKTIPPFPVLALTDSLPLQRKAAALWSQEVERACPPLPAIPKHARHKKIRLGYFSADLQNHATAYLMAELFERHDKTRFELTAFSFGPEAADVMRKRISAAFDKFIDVRAMSDRDVALLSCSMKIDVAVDLKGFTKDQRAGIFSARAAPVQASHIGYPGTSGAGFMDYLVADRTLIPPSARPQYSEKIVTLPHSYQVNDRTRAVAERSYARRDLGLPDRGFVFCCFNNNYKITPAAFDGWMRILKRVEDSVLWLYEDNAVAAGNLRKEADARGIAPARLIFARQMPHTDHLARHRAADLFLDTLPYNAHTTASDALWAGLPVLTRSGQSFAGRVAASLLNAVGLPELVAETQEHFETLAVDLALNPERLNQFRQKLATNRLTAPLFDTALFTKHIEDAYTQIYERSQNGLPPEDIEVTA